MLAIGFYLAKRVTTSAQGFSRDPLGPTLIFPTCFVVYVNPFLENICGREVSWDIVKESRIPQAKSELVVS